MKLSNGERLILIMVSEIYEKLDIKGEINPALVRDAIYGDKLWALGWEYRWTPKGSRNRSRQPLPKFLIFSTCGV